MKSSIEEAFRRGKAFIPYIMAGDPDLETTYRHVLMLQRCGADVVELGVPFSDPLADGPTIQRAAERALAAGVTLAKVLGFVKGLKKEVRIPIVLMTYYNVIFHYGEERFVRDAVEAGVAGVIIPDLPPEEAGTLIDFARPAGLDTVFLVAPTSSEDRMKKIVSAARGFVYYVSMTGITGSKLALAEAFKAHIASVRKLTDRPIAVGFGVSGPEDARMVAEAADGVIVGSAIVKKLHEAPSEAEEFVKKLREAI